MPPRICLVGAGRWSTSVHLPALQRLQASRLAEYSGVCDLDAAKARAYASALDAAPHTDLDAMLDDLHPDGLLLITGPGQLPDVIRTAIGRGIPFLCEKPPATDAETHRELRDAAGALPHVVAYNRRHAPYIARAKEWLEGAELQAVACHFARHRRRDEDFTTTAVHGIDAALYLAGAELETARLEVAPAGGVVNFFIDGWTTNGVRVSILVTPDTGSAQEHYTIRSADRTVALAFPQNPMVDRPGWVELHQENRVAARLTAADFGLADDDLSALIGVQAEEERFARMLAGEAVSISTLATSLQTQQLREQLCHPGLTERISVDWRRG